MRYGKIITLQYRIHMLQMIAELGRINDQKDVRATYLSQWTEQWLPKIVATIKDNTTELNKQRMKPFLDISDLNDKNGNTDNVFAYIYIITNLQLQI